MIELDRSVAEKYFREQPVFAQIRSVICRQGEEVDWNELKREHDQQLQKLETGEIEQLEMPEDEYVLLCVANFLGPLVCRAAFKIIPERFDFYHSLNGGIADRVVFTKDDTGKWKYVHVAA